MARVHQDADLLTCTSRNEHSLRPQRYALRAQLLLHVPFRVEPLGTMTIRGALPVVGAQSVINQQRRKTTGSTRHSTCFEVQLVVVVVSGSTATVLKITCNLDGVGFSQFFKHHVEHQRCGLLRLKE